MVWAGCAVARVLYSNVAMLLPGERFHIHHKFLGAVANHAKDFPLAFDCAAHRCWAGATVNHLGQHLKFFTVLAKADCVGWRCSGHACIRL